MKTAVVLTLFGCASAVYAQDLPRPVLESDFLDVRMEEARLGQLLFYDPILSGNQEVACATCHHPAFGTSDGLSLGIGDGGRGLGTRRVADPENLPEARVPRNAPGLFNLGASEFTRLFHDGRIEVDPTRPGGLRTPLDADMIDGFDSVLSAQTMFPVLSPDEMAGHYSENDVAQAVRRGVLTGQGGAWDIISHRVSAVPEYAQAFVAAYDHIQSPDQIAFTDISNAIAVFMAFEWRSDTAPFDAVLRGEATLPEPAQTGMTLFYGEANCASCHAGPFLTDHDFHAMGSPQIGPGKAARFEHHARDEGRFHVTGDPADLYAFRTPSLRNVMLTAPYGHAGAYTDLRAFLVAHNDPVTALAQYDIAHARLPELPVDDQRETQDAIAAVAIPAGVPLSGDQIDALIAFLGSLTDPIAPIGRLGIPETVPSGLTVPHVPM